ncbi:hypothetical protein G9A89_012880 [Geosiphon pyriformis]|nr:hypothetical protein G9A89_012880 [Geosiphon pyriformis]
MDKTKRLFNKRILQQLEHFDRPEILLNKAIDLVTSNQLGKITNAQFEELQTQITQEELNELDFDREYSIEDSLPGEIPAIKLRKKLTKLWFRKATNKTITIESLSIIQRTQPNPLDTKPSDTKLSDY